MGSPHNPALFFNCKQNLFGYKYREGGISMKILYEIGKTEIAIDTVGAKLEYIKRNGKEILNNCRICVPNYGVDKTFRYPTDGLFVDKK